MIKNPINIEDAYFQFQKEACDKIKMISQELGCPLIWNDDFKQIAENKWNKPGVRDYIEFGSMIPEKVIQTDGDAVPLESSPRWANIDTLSNDLDREGEVTKTYQTSYSTRKLREESQVHGWSITTGIAGTFGQNEANKIEISVSASASGEYGKREERETLGSLVETTEVRYPLPVGCHYVIQQRQDNAKIKVPVTQQIVFDFSCKVVGWKRLNSDLLYRGRYAAWGKTKSRLLYTIENISDLELLLLGRNPDYPNQRTDLIAKGGKLTGSFLWLKDERNRSFTVETAVIYEDASSGSVRAYDPNKKVVVDPMEDGK